MDTNTILITVLRILCVCLLSVLLPTVLQILKQKASSLEDQQLRSTISSLVCAAEQMLKEVDPTGAQRKQYVKDQLKILHIAYTPYIDAIVETCVFGINHE